MEVRREDGGGKKKNNKKKVESNGEKQCNERIKDD